MTAIDRLRAVVHAKPDDWQARLILADALEDGGDYIGANGVRWQAENKNYPCKGFGEGRYGWWCGPTTLTTDEIDKDIWRQLRGNYQDFPGSWKWYPSIAAAESALAHALHALGITAGVLSS